VASSAPSIVGLEASLAQIKKREPIARFPFFRRGGGESTLLKLIFFGCRAVLRANGEHEFNLGVLTTPDCAAGFRAGFDLHGVRSFI